MRRKRRRLKRQPIQPPVDSSSPYLVREFLEHTQAPYLATPTRFVPELSDLAIAKDLAFNNSVSVIVPKGARDCDILETIAKHAEKPFAITELSSALDGERRIRGKTCFDHVWRVIDDLALNWNRMRWWFNSKGLTMQVLTERELAIRMRLRELTPLEALAGKLAVDRTINRRISANDVSEIAKILDQKQLALKESLTPAEWQVIVARNQKYSRRPIRTFEHVFREYPRFVRRVLYRARDKYRTAMNS